MWFILWTRHNKKHSNYFSCVHSFVFCSLLNLPKSIFFTHELLLQLKLHVTLVFVILLILPWEDFFFPPDYWSSILIIWSTGCQYLLYLKLLLDFHCIFFFFVIGSQASTYCICKVIKNYIKNDYWHLLSLVSFPIVSVKF